MTNKKSITNLETITRRQCKALEISDKIYEQILKQIPQYSEVIDIEECNFMGYAIDSELTKIIVLVKDYNCRRFVYFQGKNNGDLDIEGWIKKTGSKQWIKLGKYNPR